MQSKVKQNIIFVMGVSGCGKSTIGQLLADQLSMPFIDADDHHLPSSIEKMGQGIPLTDEDREPWLDKLNQIATQHLENGVVIACSALKEKYRTQLAQSIESNVQWVYLKGDYQLIFDRMQNRHGHFMDAGMLKSQFETLEEPRNAISIDIANPVEVVIQLLSKQLVTTSVD